MKDEAMNKRIFVFGAVALAAWTLAAPANAADNELRVMVHSSFSLPKPMLAQFETQSGLKLSIIKGGDAGEMLNKLILTRAQPMADVVFGIDNALVAKAQAANVLEAHGLPALAGTVAGAEKQLGALVVPVDYGYVTLNYDKAAVCQKRPGPAQNAGRPDPARLPQLAGGAKPGHVQPGLCLHAGHHCRHG